MLPRRYLEGPRQQRRKALDYRCRTGICDREMPSTFRIDGAKHPCRRRTTAEREPRQDYRELYDSFDAGNAGRGIRPCSQSRDRGVAIPGHSKWSLFKSPIYENYGKLIAENRFQPAGFKLRLGFKDIRLGLAAADTLEVPMPLAGLIHDNFLSAVATGQGDDDWAALARVSADRAALRGKW